MGCGSSKTAKEPTKSNDEYLEKTVCNESDLQENDMKIFEIDDDFEVLVVKQKGAIRALGTKCTHYGAPLDKAALGEGRIRCQWHGACFNILNGDIEDYPGTDSLPCYQVKVENNQVRIRAKKTDLESNLRVKDIPKIENYEQTTIVLVGAGPSSAICAETLREEGFKGKIIMVGEEPHIPYDRVKVTKGMTPNIETVLLRNENFYKKIGVEVKKGTKVVCVNSQENFVKTDKEEIIRYDKLYIATGGVPRKLKVPGEDLNNVFAIKTFDDAQKLLRNLGTDKDVVCIGASFISMEIASSIVQKVSKITIVSHTKVPFETSFGHEIGEAFMNLFKEKGINFAMEKKQEKLISDDNNNVTGVELNDGTILKADVVILGIGSNPATGFLDGSGINLHINYAIEVDEYLQTNVANVYAGGDVAHAPIWTRNNKVKATIGHYGLAQKHGKTAAFNMLGKKTILQVVPFFWTFLFGKSVQYAGYGESKEIIYTGNVKEFNFVAYYLNGEDEVIAIAGSQMYPVVAQYAELLVQEKKLYRKDVENESLQWTKKLIESNKTNEVNENK